jgi:hypothetical protein
MREFGSLLQCNRRGFSFGVCEYGERPEAATEQPNRRSNMFRKTTILLSAAMVLGTALSASAATKSQLSQAGGSGFYTMIPGYAKDGSVVALPDPDHSGQPQLTGNENPLRH